MCKHTSTGGLLLQEGMQYLRTLTRTVGFRPQDHDAVRLLERAWHALS